MSFTEEATTLEVTSPQVPPAPGPAKKPPKRWLHAKSERGGRLPLSGPKIEFTTENRYGQADMHSIVFIRSWLKQDTEDLWAIRSTEEVVYWLRDHTLECHLIRDDDSVCTSFEDMPLDLDGFEEQFTQVLFRAIGQALAAIRDNPKVMSLKPSLTANGHAR